MVKSLIIDTANHSTIDTANHSTIDTRLIHFYGMRYENYGVK